MMIQFHYEKGHGGVVRGGVKKVTEHYMSMSDMGISLWRPCCSHLHTLAGPTHTAHGCHATHGHYPGRGGRQLL